VGIAAANNYLFITLFLSMTNGGSVFDAPKATDQAREERNQNKYVKKIVTFARAVKRACPGFR